MHVALAGCPVIITMLMIMIDAYKSYKNTRTVLEYPRMIFNNFILVNLLVKTMSFKGLTGGKIGDQ